MGEHRFSVHSFLRRHRSNDRSVYVGSIEVLYDRLTSRRHRQANNFERSRYVRCRKICHAVQHASVQSKLRVAAIRCLKAKLIDLSNDRLSKVEVTSGDDDLREHLLESVYRRLLKISRDVTCNEIYPI